MADAIPLTALHGPTCATPRRTRLELRVRPRRDTRPPVAIEVSGRLHTTGAPCPTSAAITLRVTRGRRTIETGDGALRRDCRYRARLSITTHRPTRSSRRITIRARFAGTALLRPSVATTTVAIL
jgi:hypothetical protein